MTATTVNVGGDQAGRAPTFQSERVTACKTCYRLGNRIGVSRFRGFRAMGLLLELARGDCMVSTVRSGAPWPTVVLRIFSQLSKAWLLRLVTAVSMVNSKWLCGLRGRRAPISRGPGHPSISRSLNAWPATNAIDAVVTT